MASERIDPRDFPGEPISLDHYARYAFAGQFAKGKRVLDAACGLGYGSSYLSAAGAVRVLGVDLAEDAIHAAREQYAADGLSFEVADAHDLSHSAAGPWDVIASFETIEHLADPGQFVAECRTVLAPDGVFVASVPNHAQDPPGANEYHIQHFDRDSFARLLRASFAFVEIVPQYFALASCIYGGDHTRVAGLCVSSAAHSASAVPGADEPECFVAVCANVASAALVPQTALVHARKFWEHHKELEEGKHWLEEQALSWQRNATELSADLERERVYLKELEAGKHWLEEQVLSWQRNATELSADLERERIYHQELEEGKRWLEEQVLNWQRNATELSADLERERVYLKELEEGKRWLEEQVLNWQRTATELSATLERERGERDGSRKT